MLKQPVYEHEGKLYVGRKRPPTDGELCVEHFCHPALQKRTYRHTGTCSALATEHEALVEIPRRPPEGFGFKVVDGELAFREPEKGEWFLGETSRREALRCNDPGWIPFPVNSGRRYILEPLEKEPSHTVEYVPPLPPSVVATIAEQAVRVGELRESLRRCQEDNNRLVMQNRALLGDTKAAEKRGDTEAAERHGMEGAVAHWRIRAEKAEAKIAAAEQRAKEATDCFKELSRELADANIALAGLRGAKERAERAEGGKRDALHDLEYERARAGNAEDAVAVLRTRLAAVEVQVRKVLACPLIFYKPTPGSHAQLAGLTEALTSLRALFPEKTGPGVCTE